MWMLGGSDPLTMTLKVERMLIIHIPALMSTTMALVTVTSGMTMIVWTFFRVTSAFMMLT